MKYLSIITVSILILSLTQLTSCKKDDSIIAGEPPSLTVSATVVNGPDLNNNGEVIATDTVDFLITVNAPAGFNSVLVGGSGNAVLTEIESGSMDSVSQTSILSHRVITGQSDGGAQVSFVFVAVDELGQESDSVRFSFEIGLVVNTLSNIVLGGFQNTTNNGFFDAIENVVYAFSGAVGNAEKIDFLFYHTGTQGYSLAAVDNTDADIAIEAQTASGDLDNFPIKNQTRFKTFSSNPNFDAIKSVTELENAFNAATGVSGLSGVTNLSDNTIIGVTLDSSRGDRIGLIRVNQVFGSIASDRSIRFDIKIDPE